MPAPVPWRSKTSTQTWQALPDTTHVRGEPAVAAVAGGMLAVGGRNDAPAELFDEASGRWFELPHPMAEARLVCAAVSLPVAALAAPAAAAAGGAAAAGP